MKKIDDFFGAGVFIGSIGNIWTTIFPIAELNLGIHTRTPWNDMAALFFRPPQLYTFWAQLFGFIATFGVAITNAIIVGALLKFTGRKFAYIKSLVVCSGSVMFAFMILYPSLGLHADQHSIITTYSAVINNQPFALLTAFLFLRFTTVGLTEPETEKTADKVPKIRFIPVPVKKPESKDKHVHIIKPRKL